MEATFQHHGLTRNTKRLVFEALLQRQHGKCFICEISQEELQERTYQKAIAHIDMLDKRNSPEKRKNWTEKFAEFAKRRSEYDTALGREQRIEIYYRRNAVHATLHIDHCHATGMIRGLLCERCNFKLSHAEHYGVLIGKVVCKPSDLSQKQFDDIIAYASQWLDQHKERVSLYMQQERWLPRKDILFHLVMDEE